jgi:O-antigen/teichoic acid export membrane protein
MAHLSFQLNFPESETLRVHKQIVGYIPANLLPAVLSFVTIYVYTRVLTPSSFGAYTFVFSVALFVQACSYESILIAIWRFYPAAEVAGKEAAFLGDVSAVFYAVTLTIVVLYGIALWLIPLPPVVANIAWMGLPLLVLRAVVGVNQAVNRASNLMARYNWIECSHAILGLGLGLLFILVLGPTAGSVILGLLIAALLCALANLRQMAVSLPVRAGRVDRVGVMRLVDFTWPLMAAGTTASLLQLSDRFVVGGLGSAEMLGIFTAAYSLVERPMTLVSVSIAIATFPMAAQALEQDGREAGRLQAGKNGAVLLALSLPACVGLTFTSHYIAAVLVGPAFQTGVALLIPIMSFTALFRAFRSHFVDHAFHLAGRPHLMLWYLAPSAVANVLLNLMLVPRYGMVGAAWSALICQAGATVVSWLIGWQVFPLWLPPGLVVRVVAAVMAMAVVLWIVQFPLTWLGLIGALALGMAVYGLASVLLDVGGIRSRIPPLV